jgi:hypothetical protein
LTAYLAAFERGADPHATTADGCFPMENKEGLRFREMPGVPPGVWDGVLFIPTGEGKWSGKAKGTRDLSKRVQYNGQYMGGVETMLRVIQDAEADKNIEASDCELIYLHLTLPEVRLMRERWLARSPEYLTGWQAEINHYRQHGYVADSIMGRRRDFLDGENPNEIVNFPIQSSAAAYVNIATLEVVKEIPFERWGPGTGLVVQVHDSLLLEVPRAQAQYAAEVLNSAMNRTFPSLPGVRFTGTAAIGWKKDESGAVTKLLSWKDV